MRRVPIESARPIVVFAITRLAVAVVALAAVAVVDFPHQEAAAIVLGVFVLWSTAGEPLKTAGARVPTVARLWRTPWPRR